MGLCLRELAQPWDLYSSRISFRQLKSPKLAASRPLQDRTNLVYTIIVRTNTIFSGGESDIELAPEKVRSRDNILSTLPRVAEVDYGPDSSAEVSGALMRKLRYADAGRKFTRDEMNGR